MCLTCPHHCQIDSYSVPAKSFLQSPSLHKGPHPGLMPSLPGLNFSEYYCLIRPTLYHLLWDQVQHSQPPCRALLRLPVTLPSHLQQGLCAHWPAYCAPASPQTPAATNHHIPASIYLFLPTTLPGMTFSFLSTSSALVHCLHFVYDYIFERHLCALGMQR